MDQMDMAKGYNSFQEKWIERTEIFHYEPDYSPQQEPIQESNVIDDALDETEHITKVEGKLCTVDLISWFEVVCLQTEAPTVEHRTIHSVATGVAAILASQVLLCPAATTPGKPPT